jgi:putative endonuclease
MIHHQYTGKRGERLAAAFLCNAGYEILQTNWRWKHAEIDIIARHNDVLVFVEVKTRSSTIYGLPEESVSQAKQCKLAEAAEAYLEQTRHKGEIRFDIISILVQKNRCEILHLKDAFFPSAE